MVGLSSDGNTAIFSGYNDGGGLGAAWIFTRSNGNWSQQGGKLIGTNPVGAAGVGRSVALSGDGDTAFIGAAFDTSLNGAAWVFRRANGVWTQEGPKLGCMGANAGARCGSPLALSTAGRTALLGAYQDEVNVGSAILFVRACAQGDTDGDGDVDVGDVFYLINFLFANGPPPACS
jgi:hypothetical protein